MNTPHKSLTVLDGLIACIALLSMSGWFLDIITLASIIPGHPTMKFNTALCFLLITVLHLSLIKKASKVLTITLGSAVFIISSLTLLQDILGQSFFIDELFMKDGWTAEHGYSVPGRMSEATCVSFMLISIAHLLFLFKYTRLSGQYLLHIVSFISFISLLAYIYQVPINNRQWMFTSMSISTSVGFLLVAFRASMIHSEQSLSGMLIGDLLGNRMTQILFPSMTLTSLILGYCTVLGVKSSSISPEFGTVLYTSAFWGIGLFVIHMTGRKINELDKEKALEITERKESEKWFQAVIEASPSAMIVVNQKGLVTLMNKQAETLFGYNQDELLGKPVKSLVPESVRERHPTYSSGFFQNPTSRPMGAGRDLFGVHKDGTEIPIEIGLNPVKSQKDISVLASIIDIRERKAKEKAERLNIELHTRQQELEQLTYIASHDLQEPLRTVSNYINILEEDYGDSIVPEATAHLNTINNATQRMSMLISALLDYSRLGQGRQLENTSTQNILNDVLKDLEILIENTGAQVTAKAFPELNVYLIEFRQLIQNLISNAIKFRKENAKPVINIECKSHGSNWLFSIRDNGIGIAGDHLEKIFFIFQRLHKKSEYEGHGIGLANCKKIVEMHGGKIWVESIPDIGSTFFFTIPKE